MVLDHAVELIVAHGDTLVEGLVERGTLGKVLQEQDNGGRASQTDHTVDGERAVGVGDARVRSREPRKATVQGTK